MERKHPTHPGNDVCRKRPRTKSLNSDDPAFTSTATDEEVEQFFAIIRQMQAAKMMVAAAAAAAAGIGKSEGEKGKGVDEWTPAFRWEDFAPDGKRLPPKTGRAEQDSSSSRESRESQRHARGGRAPLDLNADPDPDVVPA